ncbi:glyoxal reductase-like [Paramacrobiotus metropolitanus]|uniref:glyoxal reductase-like n=1 Tax=Paramacrobiotus metropolitanus TaxID=2943436 RepID=UPI0024465820|nr:glyoxal reductase-like [Paramacrobiotus metropolitanus]
MCLWYRHRLHRFRWVAYALVLHQLYLYADCLSASQFSWLPSFICPASLNDTMAVQHTTHTITTIAGVQMPRLIYGTAWKKDATTDLVVKAVLAGFRGIDTACQPKHYQEPLVGKALATLHEKHAIPREDLFVQTKFTSVDGQDPQNIPYDPRASLTDQVRQSVSASLRNLQTTYIDSLVLHGPMHSHQENMEVWRTLEDFHSQGTIRQLGISNFYRLAELEKLFHDAHIKPAVVQNRFHAETGYDVEIRAFCRKHGIIYQSFWTLTANPHLLRSAVIKDMAHKRQATVEQVFFRFCMDLGIAPLTGTKDERHMKEDLAVLDMEPMSRTEVEQIEHLMIREFSGHQALH